MSDNTIPSESATATDDVSRRRLLQATGTVAAGVAVGSGVASAQSGDGGQIYTDAVLSNSTPTFGKGDYTGLYLKIEDPRNDPDTTGVSACDVVGSDDRLAAYNAVISEKVDVGAESESAGTTVYIAARESAVETGKQFVVNEQTDCPGGHVSVRLEQVGESSIGTANDDGESAVTSPGFSAVTGIAGIAGVGAAAVAAVKRAARDE